MKCKSAFTIIELIIVMIIGTIVLSGIAVFLSDGQRGWQLMYDSIHSDVYTDSFVARKKFDSMIRKSSGENVLLDEDGDWLEVHYYANVDSTSLDRYARFYESNGVLNVENGTVDSEGLKQTTDTQQICENVSAYHFSQIGRSVQMILTLDNESKTNTIITSAVMEN